jgi:hypothetical protein
MTIQSIERTRVDARLIKVLDHCNKSLHPLLSRLLNPNVVEARIVLTLSIQAGSVNHYRATDIEPGYVSMLPFASASGEELTEVLRDALIVLRARLHDKIGSTWHGIVELLVAIDNGQASISSKADQVHKPA